MDKKLTNKAIEEKEISDQTKRFRMVLDDLKSKKSLTYEKLAAAFNKRKSFISEMANGRTTPNREVVKHLSEVYGVDENYIYAGAENMYKEGTYSLNQFIVSKLHKNEAMLDVMLEFLTEMFEKDELSRKKLIDLLNDRILEKVSLYPGRKEKG